MKHRVKFTPKFKVGQKVYIVDSCSFYDDVICDVILSVIPTDISQEHTLYSFDPTHKHRTNYYEMDVFATRHEARAKFIYETKVKLLAILDEADHCTKALNKCCNDIEVLELKDKKIRAFENKFHLRII